MVEPEAVYARIDRRVAFSDADEDWEYRRAMRRITAPERALWVTRFLERELADGGWYLVFANEREYLIRPAIRAYELLGLTAYARHLREVLASGYGDASSEAAGEALDEAYARLSGADDARAAFLEARGLGA